MDLNTYSLGVIYLCYLFLKLHNIDAVWLYSYINAEKATFHWGKDTVAFFFFKGVGGELIIYHEQERNSEQLREAREGGRNGKISGRGV